MADRLDVCLHLSWIWTKKRLADVEMKTKCSLGWNKLMFFLVGIESQKTDTRGKTHHSVRAPLAPKRPPSDPLKVSQKIYPVVFRSCSWPLAFSLPSIASPIVKEEG